MSEHEKFLQPESRVARSKAVECVEWPITEDDMVERCGADTEDHRRHSAILLRRTLLGPSAGVSGPGIVLWRCLTVDPDGAVDLPRALQTQADESHWYPRHMVSRIGGGSVPATLECGTRRVVRAGLVRVVVGSTIIFGVLSATSCGLFDTEYEPVQKGQAVQVDVQADSAAQAPVNVPLPTAGPNGNSTVGTVGPTGASGASGASGMSPSESISAGSLAASPFDIAAGGNDVKTGGSGRSVARPVSGGATNPSTVTTVPDPVIATVAPLPTTVPMNVPPEIATTIQTEDYQAFCEATAGLRRVGLQILQPSPNLDLTHYRDLVRASLQYIVLVRDSYPDADRSVFASVIDAASQTERQLDQLTTVDSTLAVVQEFTNQQEGPFAVIYGRRATVCANSNS